MGCFVGCLRLIAIALWRALLAALVAILLARIDAYVERRFGDHPVGGAYRRWRGTKVRRGTPPDAASAIEGRARDDPGVP